MEFVLQLIATPAIILSASKVTTSVYVKNWKAAFWASLWIIIVGFLIGWLLTLILNLATLGIFWFTGLGFITRTITYALVIELIDQLKKDFDTKGFLPSLGLSIALAVTWGVIEMIL